MPSVPASSPFMLTCPVESFKVEMYPNPLAAGFRYPMHQRSDGPTAPFTTSASVIARPAPTFSIPLLLCECVILLRTYTPFHTNRGTFYFEIVRGHSRAASHDAYVTLTSSTATQY